MEFQRLGWSVSADGSVAIAAKYNDGNGRSSKFIRITMVVGIN